MVCPFDATGLVDAPDADDPLIGTVVGDCYEIVQIVGYGGMATVYAARHTRLPDKRFAIKFLLPEFAVKPEVVIRFGREAETASRIQHPNVVDVYDVHRAHDGTPYIVCEYLDGNEFGNMLEEFGKIEPELAVDVARQVCLGLGAAHAAGVVHRDMKPENVFLVGDPAHPLVKVIDFGISKITDTDESSKLTRTGFVMGTPAYMPPEQAKGGVIDHRTDVYGVGAILYRALTGHAPFEGDDPGALLAAVLTREPRRPRTLDPSIPEDLELVIERAMAKNPDDRYQSVDAMAADLAEWELIHRRAALGSTGASSNLSSTDASLALELDNPKALAQTTRHARRARPNIIALSSIAFVWLFTGVFELVVASVTAAGACSSRPRRGWSSRPSSRSRSHRASFGCATCDVGCGTTASGRCACPTSCSASSASAWPATGAARSSSTSRRPSAATRARSWRAACRSSAACSRPGGRGC